jgi:hypothetical protein
MWNLPSTMVINIPTDYIWTKIGKSAITIIERVKMVQILSSKFNVIEICNQ